MINQRPPQRRLPNSKRLWLLSLSLLLLMASPVRTFAQGPRPLVPLPQLQQPCANSDTSERCQLRRAVSAALDDIANLQKQLKLAQAAIEQQEKAIQAANQAIEASAKERAAYEKTIGIAEKAIAQQQQLIETYQKAIQTLQQMVTMAMSRIKKLEDKVDRANGRTAILGAILTAASIIAVIVK